jgi:hypothetical protein
MCKYFAKEAGLYRIHIFESVDANLLKCRMPQAGQDYLNCSTTNPAKGKVFSRTDSNGLLNRSAGAGKSLTIGF